MEIVGELLATANALLFAFSNIFNKRALEKMDKDSGMVITLVVNNALNAFALLILYLTGHWVPVRAGGIAWFITAGVLTSFIGRYLILESVNVNGPSRAGAYKVASPVFTFFIGMFIFNEQVNHGSLAGAALSLTGLWLISIRNLSRKEDPEEGISVIKRHTGNLGVLIGLGSGLCFALGMASRKAGMLVWPSALAGALTGSMTALTVLLVSFLFRQKTLPWRQLTGRKAANYIYSGISTGLAIPCFFFAILYIPVTIANVIASLEPMFTVLLAFWIMRKKEKITGTLVFGAVMVSVGAALIFIF